MFKSIGRRALVPLALGLLGSCTERPGVDSGLDSALDAGLDAAVCPDPASVVRGGSCAFDQPQLVQIEQQAREISEALVAAQASVDLDEEVPAVGVSRWTDRY